MDIKKREFKVNPPKEPITSLRAIVDDYKWRFPRDRRDMVWEWCRKAPGLQTAITRACDSRGEDGKMHNHQTRVSMVARDEFAFRLGRQGRAILHIRSTPILATDTRFDALHDMFDDIRPIGIGPVTLYDVATRVGAFLDVHPTSLYVHAGVRSGIQWLEWSLPSRVGNDGNLASETWADVWRKDRLTAKELHEYWPEFDGLPPDEIEDLLCTYRDCFMDCKDDRR